MGSVRHRLAEARHDCNVVLIGDSKVGKTALVNRYVHSKFTETYRATTFEKISSTAMVANRRVKYTIWDTTGSHQATATRNLAYNEADVFLLCYKISDPTTLFAALNFWCPEVRAVAPSTPIILVGCQSDMRRDRDSLASLSKQGKAPVSSDQALTFSQQIAALMYVETSVRSAGRTAQSAFEVAALASMGKIVPKHLALTPSPKMNKKQRFSTISPEDSLERGDNFFNPNLGPVEQFWDQFSHFQSPKLNRSHSESPKTPSLGSSRSASLSSKTRSGTSIPSISSYGGSKTPKAGRRSSTSSSSNGKGQVEKMITIKCQRLTADKTYEEIEVEVPAPIYETIQLYNDTGNFTARCKERRSFGSKLKHLFTSKN